MQDLHLLKELQRAFSKPVVNGFIELDRLVLARPSFNIFRLEDLYAGTKGIIPPYRQSNFLVLFVREGAGKRLIGPNTFTIRNNSLAIIPPRVIHASTYTMQPRGYFIIFRADFLLQQAFPYKLLTSKSVLKPSCQPFTVLNCWQAADITAVFEKIIEECNSGYEEKKQMIALKLLELLLLCDRFFREKTAGEDTPDYPALLQTFNELIEHHFARHRNVQFYAAALHTHPNHLNALVKKATGLTAKQSITNRLVSEAKYFLVSTTLSVKEIAHELGFEDPNYFISFFKKNQHITPAGYRRQFV
ncbi:MAG TPA: AraC family transcriptional regulator [Flavisolibacter sp.]|nr:AraC family transcriptional regulator [Flavisolibacter sp.]